MLFLLQQLLGVKVGSRLALQSTTRTYTTDTCYVG